MNDRDINEYSLNSYCFLFYKNEIIFKEYKDCHRLFLVNEVEKFGINDSEMIYIGIYASGEIVIDNNEIEAADWFPLDNLPNIPENRLSFARILINFVIESRKGCNSNLIN